MRVAGVTVSRAGGLVKTAGRPCRASTALAQAGAVHRPSPGGWRRRSARDLAACACSSIAWSSPLPCALLLVGPRHAARRRPRPATAPGRWRRGPRSSAGFDPPATAGARATAASTCSGTPASRCAPRSAGTVTFAGAARRAGRGGRRPRRHPHDLRAGERDGARRRRGGPRRASSARCSARRSHCFPRACLHWGLRRGDTYLDPLTLVGAGPIRLLPLAVRPGARRRRSRSGAAGAITTSPRAPGAPPRQGRRSRRQARGWACR